MYTWNVNFDIPIHFRVSTSINLIAVQHIYPIGNMK